MSSEYKGAALHAAQHLTSRLGLFSSSIACCMTKQCVKQQGWATAVHFILACVLQPPMTRRGVTSYTLVTSHTLRKCEERQYRLGDMHTARRLHLNISTIQMHAMNERHKETGSTLHNVDDTLLGLARTSKSRPPMAAARALYSK